MADLGAVKRKVAELESKNDIDKAISELEKAIQDFPKEGSLFNKLGDLYIKVSRQREALEIYLRGARVFKEETYYPNAIALCKKILRLDTERTDVYFLLGDLHKELGQRVEAANYLLEFAERKVKAGNLEEALNTYNVIKELVPNNSKILQTISAIYAQLGKKDQGAEFLKEAQQIETKQKEIKDTFKAGGTVEKPVEIAPEIELAKPPEKPLVPSEPKFEPPPVVAEKTADMTIDDIVSPEIAELLKDEIRETEVKPTVEKPVDAASSSEIPAAEIPVTVEEKVDATVISGKTEEKATAEPDINKELSEIDKTIELGELYLNLGSEEEAIDCFRNAAVEAFNQDEHDRSAKLNKRISDLRPTDLKSRQQLVEIAQIKNDKPTQIIYMLELAEALNRRDAKSQAQDLFRKVLDLDPENAQAKEMIIEIKEPAKDFIDLGEVLRTEIDTDKNPEGLQNIQDLISQFRKEVFDSIGEGDYRSHYDLGVAYKGMGLFQEAMEEFEIASRDINLKLKAYESIGSCLLERGKSEDAIKILNDGLRVQNRPGREYFGIYFLLASCYENLNNLPMALKAYMNAYNMDKTVTDLTKKINELKVKVTEELKKKGKIPATPTPLPKKEEETKPKEPEKVAAKKSKVTYL
jgi:tetratricopeptide (TPR) repeat protein